MYTGLSHSSDYSLFRNGEVASRGVQEFAETASTATFDKEGISADGDSAILDGFTAPPVLQGEGLSGATVFVDGNHSLISAMSKIVPSPDWFVGLDSLNLCEGGRFVESVTVQVRGPSTDFTNKNIRKIFRKWRKFLR